MYKLNTPSHIASQINTSPQIQPSVAHAEQHHPNKLALAKLSLSTQLALDQFEDQASGHDQLLILLARNGLANRALQLKYSQGTEVHYKQEVTAPSTSGVSGARQIGDLTVRTQLNVQSKYDILGIDLHVPSSGAQASINLPIPSPAFRKENNKLQTGGDKQLYRLNNLKSQNQLQIWKDNVPENLTKPSQTISTSPKFMPFGSFLLSQKPIANREIKRKVPDPENPGKLAYQNTLNKRRYDRKLVADPGKPGLMVSKNALSKRNQKQLVVDPRNAEKTVTKNALNKRGKTSKRVDDPKNPGQTITLNALSKRKLVDDPRRPGKKITQASLNLRKLVADPIFPGNMITKSVLASRKRTPRRLKQAAQT